MLSIIKFNRYQVDQPPDIDLAKIDFPSDRLTIKTLRTIYPSEVDSERVEIFKDQYGGCGGADVGGMLQVERELATVAFNRVLEKNWSSDILEFKPDLAELYIRYGIASGQYHADQLIRDFESQATEQARKHAGRRL